MIPINFTFGKYMWATLISARIPKVLLPSMLLFTLVVHETLRGTHPPLQVRGLINASRLQGAPLTIFLRVRSEVVWGRKLTFDLTDHCFQPKFLTN